ncbi:MAG: P1 family peptidase [Planctomycetota bacterium]
MSLLAPSLPCSGEVSGSHFIAEKGLLISPILITNTISVGSVHEATVKWSISESRRDAVNLPVVAETWDGALNDIYGFHVQQEHVFEALEGATSGPVAEGNVGGGTGMICHGFKGGIGTSSRVVQAGRESYTIGVLVQANHGQRGDLMIAGIPIGSELPAPRRRAREGVDAPLARDLPAQNGGDQGAGSVIVVVATDAPMLPSQLQRILRRVPMGIARVGSSSSSYSGDIFIGFSTTAPNESAGRGAVPTTSFVSDRHISSMFRATVQATEEAIVNALIAAETMVGRNGHRVEELPEDSVVDLLRRHDRLEVSDGEEDGK